MVSACSAIRTLLHETYMHPSLNTEILQIRMHQNTGDKETGQG